MYACEWVAEYVMYACVWVAVYEDVCSMCGLVCVCVALCA